MTTNPIEIQGAWTRGWSLDRHTSSSVFLGYNEYGHEEYNTTRSPLGELLYQLKYRCQNNVEKIAAVLATFFDNKPNTLARIDLVVPVPPSTPRPIQPVIEVADAAARKLGKAFSEEVVQKTQETPSLKNIHDPEERREVLTGVFKVDAARVSGKGILLVDDLYRSGAKANAVTVALFGSSGNSVARYCPLGALA